MSTVINNPATNPTPIVERTVVETDSGGWIVAVILLLVIAGAAFWYFRYYQAQAAPAQQPATTINVTLPTPTSAQTQPAQ